MTRIIRGVTIPPNSVGVTIDLILGPTEFTEEQLELAWAAYGEELMRNNNAGRSLPGVQRDLTVVALEEAAVEEGDAFAPPLLGPLGDGRRQSLIEERLEDPLVVVATSEIALEGE